MVELVVATSILFLLAISLTAAWWLWLTRTMSRKIDDATRRLKIDLIECQSSNLEQFVRHLQQLPEPVELDIAPLADRLLKVEKAVAEHAQLATDRQKVLDRKLHELAESIDNIPYPLGPKPVDLAPVYDRFQSIDAQLSSLGKMINRATLSDIRRDDAR